MSESDENKLSATLRVSAVEANHWWRKYSPVGALLNNLMFAFIVGPVVLVFKNFEVLSFVVFALMIPYGLLVRRMAILAVRTHLANHPESMLEFRKAGIIL